MFMQWIFIYFYFSVVSSQSYNLVGFFEADEDETPEADPSVTKFTEEEAFRKAIDQINEARDESMKIVAAPLTLTSHNPFLAINDTCNEIQKGIIGIIGPKSLSNINAVQSVCDEKEIPHILTRWIYHPPRKGSAINFYPHPPLLTRAYLDIIKAWKWKTFTVLYEDDESLLRLSELIVTSKKNGIVVTVEQLDRDGTGIYRNALIKIRHTKQRFIVLDCHIKNLVPVLQQCQQIGLMTSDYNYIITNLDAHTKNLTPFQWSLTNITGIRLVNPESKLVQAAVGELFKDIIDPNEPKISFASRIRTETALIIDAVNMFTKILDEMEENRPEREEPLIQVTELDCQKPDSWEFGYSLVNLLRTSSYRGITGPIQFDFEGHRSHFGLQVYELREGGIINVATWNSTEGLNITRKHQRPDIGDANSMTNRTFKVIITLTEPYGMLKETPENLYGNDRYEGFGIDLIHEIAQLEHFNYTFVVQDDGDNGSQQKNGEWTGMIGKVRSGEVDMAITDLTINSERAEAVDFTSPFMNLGVSILFQKPQKAPPSFFSFAAPFATDTWIALAVAFVVVSLSFFFLGRICPDEWTNPYPCVEEPEFLFNQFSLTNSVWFVTGAMLQQGSEIAPIAIPTRLVSGVWWFFVLIMVSSYTANLASFLVTENNVDLFTNVRSLVENADRYGIKYGAKYRGATLKFFEKSQNELYQKIAAHMKAHPDDVVKGNDKGVSRAETEKYAFFMESTTIEYITQRHCNLTMIGDRLDEKGYGIALQKNSPYRQRLSTAILKLQSGGVIEKIRKKWWEERKGGGQCTESSESTEAQPLDLQNVEGIFYVTIFGTILGAVLVVFEYLFSIARMSKKAKMPFKEALKRELQFFLQFNNNVKPVLEVSEDDEEKSESKSESERSKSKSIKSKNTSKTAVNGENIRPYGFVINAPSLNRLTESP